MSELASSPEPQPEFRGVVLPERSQLRLRDLTFDVEKGLAIGGYDVRWDIWPTWLRVAEAEHEAALAARAGNPGVDEQPGFSESLMLELQHAMTSICATAFALEAFTNSVIHHKPKAAIHVQPGQRIGAASRIHQTWMRAFRIENRVSSESRVILGQIFRLRNAAVHAPASFNEPAMHPVYPVGIDTRFLMFRSENAGTAAQFTRHILRYMAKRPRPGNDEWIAWCAVTVEMATQTGGVRDPDHDE